MKRTLSIVCALCLSTAAFGQADDGKGVMMNPEGKYDLLSQAWQFEDADPLETGTFDLRFGLQWSTGRSTTYIPVILRFSENYPCLASLLQAIPVQRRFK